MSYMSELNDEMKQAQWEDDEFYRSRCMGPAPASRVDLTPEAKPQANSRREFETFQDAFNFCRSRNSPVIVMVNGEKWHLFPSGRAVQCGGRK
jgi:hypothetical protein